MNAEKLIRICQNRKIWIQTHNFPDPDALASAYGLMELLERYGIESHACYDGDIDKLSSTKMLKLLKMDIHPVSEVQEKMTEKDQIILVDCQKRGGNITDLSGYDTAVIDHHATFVQANYTYKDIRITGSCATLIAHYFYALNLEPSEKVATALIYGMRMDTLQFSRGTTELDIEMYAFLFPRSSQKLLQKLEQNNMELTDLRAYGAAIEHIVVYGGVCFSYIDFACPDALVGILSDFLLSFAEIDVVILYARRKDGYKFSFRSERKGIHIGDLANIGLRDWGNGGGHSFMAGGFASLEKLEALNIRKEEFFDVVQRHFIKILMDFEQNRK